MQTENNNKDLAKSWINIVSSGEILQTALRYKHEISWLANRSSACPGEHISIIELNIGTTQKLPIWI